MRRFLLLLLVGTSSILSACAPESLADLGRHFAIQGVVTDLGTATAGIPTAARSRA